MKKELNPATIRNSINRAKALLKDATSNIETSQDYIDELSNTIVKLNKKLKKVNNN